MIFPQPFCLVRLLSVPALCLHVWLLCKCLRVFAAAAGLLHDSSCTGVVPHFPEGSLSLRALHGRGHVPAGRGLTHSRRRSRQKVR